MAQVCGIHGDERVQTVHCYDRPIGALRRAARFVCKNHVSSGSSAHLEINFCAGKNKLVPLLLCCSKLLSQCVCVCVRTPFKQQRAFRFKSKHR